MMITMDPHEAKLKRVQDELKQLKKEVETERKKISECAQEWVFWTIDLPVIALTIAYFTMKRKYRIKTEDVKTSYYLLVKNEI